ARRPARARAASGTGCPTRARAGPEAARAGAPPSRRCPRPSGRGGRSPAGDLEHSVRPVLDRVALLDAGAQPAAERRAVGPGERAQLLREIARVLAAKAELRRQ